MHTKFYLDSGADEFDSGNIKYSWERVVKIDSIHTKQGNVSWKNTPVMLVFDRWAANIVTKKKSVYTS
ncbi:hypothetical protein CU098_009226, partial [Rhizopus stolonifer]